MRENRILRLLARGAVCLLLAVGLMTAAMAYEAPRTGAFWDVPRDRWYYPPIREAYETGLMDGVTSVFFDPEEDLTRGVLLTALGRTEGISRQDYAGPTAFSDVAADSPLAPYANWASQTGVLEQTGTALEPEKPVTREQLAIQICRFLARTDTPLPAAGEPAEDFHDGEKASPRGRAAMEVMGGCGLISGDLEGNFRPADITSRAEAAAVLVRLRELVSGAEALDRRPWDIEPVYDPAENRVIEVPEGVKIPILEYHNVSDITYEPQSMFISPADITWQIETLLDQGYEPIFFSDLSHLEDYTKPVIITVDDGYWDNYANLFNILQAYQVKATIFMIADKIDDGYYLTAQQIREMSDSGLVEFGSHTVNHYDLATLTDQEQEYQLLEPLRILSSLTGKAPCVVSYPYGSRGSTTAALAAKYYSFAVIGTDQPWITGQTRYEIPRFYIYWKITPDNFARMLSK